MNNQVHRVPEEMGMSREYDNDERPSWRDIDKKRDGSSHVRQEKKGEARPGEDRWNTGRYKKALEKLFLGDKGTIEHQKLHNKIHKSYGSPGFVSAVHKYIDAYGPPDDTSTLLLLLDAKDQEIMIMAMEKVQAIFDGILPREKEDIRRKLSIVALTERSVDIKEKAAEIVEDLKSRS
jgi:hypothetical protein